MNNSSELIPVKIIRSKGLASVVEWRDPDDRFRRSIVPSSEILELSKNTFAVDEQALDMGIPYGADWESRLKRSYVITGSRIAQQLEESGIWTKEDYEKNPSVAQQAVLGAARDVLADLYGVIRSIPNQEE